MGSTSVRLWPVTCTLSWPAGFTALQDTCIFVICHAGFTEGVQAGLRWGAAKASVKTLAAVCGQMRGTTSWSPQASPCCLKTLAAAVVQHFRLCRMCAHLQVEVLAAHMEAIPDRLAMLGALRQVLNAPGRYPLAWHVCCGFTNQVSSSVTGQVYLWPRLWVTRPVWDYPPDGLDVSFSVLLLQPER
jgi:hypothetical protein